MKQAHFSEKPPTADAIQGEEMHVIVNAVKKGSEKEVIPEKLIASEIPEEKEEEIKEKEI